MQLGGSSISMCLVLIAVTSCSGGDGNKTDSTPSTAPDGKALRDQGKAPDGASSRERGTGSAETGAGCDLVTSAGCAPPLKCTFLGSTGCGPAGSGVNGTSCVQGGDAVCARGFGCVSTSGTENDTSICRAYCHQDSDCPTGGKQLCPRFSVDSKPIFCQGFVVCAPLGDGCESGKGCYPALLNDGTPICLASGDKKTGEPCTVISECKKGSVCVLAAPNPQGTCRDLCAIGTTCAGGSPCQAFPGNAVGFCP